MISGKGEEGVQRVAIITGGNRGLGYEICNKLANLNYAVILTSRKEDDGIRAVKKINNRNVSYFNLDVTSKHDILQLKKHINKKFGRLDVLINNAGVLLDQRGYGKGRISSIFDVDLEILRETIETNAISVFSMCQELIPIMQRNNYGRVVNISSQSGQLTHETHGVPCYRVSKTALNAVTRVFSDETVGENILVNSVCPVWAKTDMGGPNATKKAKDSIGTIIWSSMFPDNGPTGRFFQDYKEIPW